MRNTIAAFICVFIFLGCNKNDKEQLPEATQTGARTFGCKVNGHLFVLNTDPESNWEKAGVTFDFGADSSIIIYAKHWSRESVGFRFMIQDRSNTYYLITHYPYVGEFTGARAIKGSSGFRTDAINTGVVNISYFDGKIVSGTFSFDAANDSGEIVHVTEGRFDLPRSSR